jgi:hypothetical protein
VPCASVFRDRVLALAARRRVNAGDIARSVLLLVPPAALDALPDPGEPDRDDREAVILKSGRAEGRPWRRKPRLQVRMVAGYTAAQIRRALGLALALEAGETALHLESPRERARIRHDEERLRRQLAAHREETDRLRAVVSTLLFDPLPGGVRSRADALHVLGFPPGSLPDTAQIRARFRALATVHHPDGNFGSHPRMSQLNAAMELLRRGGG